MKKAFLRMVTSFGGFLLVMAVSNLYAEDITPKEKEPIDQRFEVKISPTKVALSQSSSDKKGVKLTLSITNNQETVSVFNKFYDCWSPVLRSKSGELVKLNYARDATRAPATEDFPEIGPGESQSAEARFTFFQRDKVIHICIWDCTGGAFSGPITEGVYSLHIDYVSEKSEWITEVSQGQFGFTFENLLEGKKKSNVVKVIVEK